MPTYVYEVITDDDEPGQIFEVVQSMSEPALTGHPTTGQPVRRVIQPPHLPGKWTDRHAKKALSNENLAAQGFTKYERTGDGGYHRTAGDGGPELLKPSD